MRREVPADEMRCAGARAPARCPVARRGDDVRVMGKTEIIVARKGHEVTAVDDDGTIHFADGTTQWYHLPAKLRQEIELTDGAVILASPYVLRVARGDGAWSGFSLGDEPTPCTDVASSAAKSAGKQVVRANNG